MTDLQKEMGLTDVGAESAQVQYRIKQVGMLFMMSDPFNDVAALAVTREQKQLAKKSLRRSYKKKKFGTCWDNMETFWKDWCLTIWKDWCSRFWCPDDLW